MKTETIDGTTWFIDENNNRVSLERWGSEEAAIAALESCRSCSDRTNCDDCICSHDCVECIGLHSCRGNSSCKNCFDANNCTDCTGCVDCDGCTDCHYCFGCEHKKSLHYSYTSSSGEGDEDVDFHGQFSLEDYEVPDIHRQVYEAASQPRALYMGDWHECKTTHCWAGWAIHIAGKAAYALEELTQPDFAALVVYKASGYEISPNRFFDFNDDEEALEDIKRLAESAQ